LKNIGSEHPSPEGLPSVFTVIDQRGKNPGQAGQLLEMRTDEGPVFVRPSRWQRIRLRRNFRHFHVIPPQLLSRSHHRLIEKLLRTAVVRPDPTVPGDAVFGVVEKVHAKSAVESPRLTVVSPEPTRTLAVLPKPAIQILPRPAKLKEPPIQPSAQAVFGTGDAGFWPWIVSGAAAAAFIPLIMASVYGISLLSSTPEVKDTRAAATPIEQVAKNRAPEQPRAAASVPALSAKSSLPAPPTRKHRESADSPLPARQEPATVSTEAVAHPERRFVSELPQGYFAHPVAPTRNLVGEVRLKALIGADGSVKQVTVLSGDRRLGQAAMRAVMRWHYSPYEVLGNPVTVETEIKMSFFGPDAVSIASVSDGTGSQLK
jgi:TonB family protein